MLNKESICVTLFVLMIFSVTGFLLYCGLASEISEHKYEKVANWYKDNITTELDDGYISHYEYEILTSKGNRQNIEKIIKSITPAETKVHN